jgi:serine/threonine-protein kinase
VLISSHGQAKLVDFGLAAIGEGWDDGSGESRSTRAIDYAGLERATGVRKDDTRSDIYFCGCMFYHMLSGEPPLIETRDRLQRLSKKRFLAVKPIHHIDPSLPPSIVAVVNKAMAAHPEHRYQTPGEMVADLQVAAKKLIRESPGAGDDPQQDQERENRKRLAATLMRTIKPKHSLMVVESAVEMQDALRDGFKRAGYRVLLTSDPRHALNRFRQNDHTADAVLFSCQQIGEAALTAFNEFGEPDEKTAKVPAILLLDEKQQGWKEKARHQDRHRVVLTMPITLKQLRAELAKLVPPG